MRYVKDFFKVALGSLAYIGGLIYCQIAATLVGVIAGFMVSIAGLMYSSYALSESIYDYLSEKEVQAVACV
mgnify:CR=1 FL=1